MFEGTFPLVPFTSTSFTDAAAMVHDAWKGCSVERGEMPSNVTTGTPRADGYRRGRGDREAAVVSDPLQETFATFITFMSLASFTEIIPRRNATATSVFASPFRIVHSCKSTHTAPGRMRGFWGRPVVENC